MIFRQVCAIFLSVILGCGSTHHTVRLESSGSETTVHVPVHVDVEPVRLTPEEFSRSLENLAMEVHLLATPRETVRRMFQPDVLSGDYVYLLRDRKLVPAGSGTPLDGALTEEEEKLTSDYMGWCRRAYHFDGDCLGGALVEGRYLDMQGRYVLALALSKSPVLDEMRNALGEMVSIQSVMSTALWTVGTLMILLTLPEPVTKALAASMATLLILWVGVDTLYNLITGWLELTREVMGATTFAEIREAGERYGKLIGRDAARAFVLLAMAAINQTAQGFTARVQTLPGSDQVAMQAEAQAGIWLPLVAEVKEVSVTAEGFLVMLPPGVLAMASSHGRGSRIEDHHIGTITNELSTARGGPWTPRLKKLYARAGMQLQDPENIVPVEGHRGPHPERYHRIIYERLGKALSDCRSIDACRVRLTRALERLAEEIATPGTELNQLVTQGKPRQ